jgi:hypothetical protein
MEATYGHVCWDIKHDSISKLGEGKIQGATRKTDAIKANILRISRGAVGLKTQLWF